MTGKELIFTTFRHEEPSRTAWVPYTGVQVGQLKGYSAREVLTDSEKLFACLLEAKRQYSPDGMPVIFDLQVEAEILGCDLLWSDDTPPTVSSHPLANDKKIPESVPGSGDGRVPLILDVMRRLKAEVGQDTALYGLVCGPFTLASHLRSTNIFMDMYDDEAYVKELLEYCTDVAIALSDYYIDAGMDVLGAVDPLISQISPDMFQQYMAAPYKRYFEHIRSRGVFSAFFVCGDATKNLDVMCQTSPDCLCVDENIDMKAAKEITDAHNIVLSGNLQLTIVMLLGNQADNQKAAIEMIDGVGGRNFILAPGCDMPYATPVENIIGIGQAVQNVDATRDFLEAYVKEEVEIDVEIPNYAELDKVLIEVLTIDSSSCAACGYMKASAEDMKEFFGDKVEVVEYKITEPENIARIGKMGVKNLPAMCLNGEVKHVSLIPNREDLKKEVEEVLSKL